MPYESKVKDGNIELLNLHGDIRKLIDEWEGKSMPSDVETQLDGMETKASDLRKRITRMVSSDELDTHINEVDTEKRLEVVAGAETKEYIVDDSMKRFNDYMYGGARIRTPQDWLTEHKSFRLSQIKRPGADFAAEEKAFHYYLFGDQRPGNLGQLRRTAETWDRQSFIGNPEVKAALNEGTTTQGGFLTPDIFAQEIILPLANESWMRTVPRIRIINITSDNFRFPRTAYSAAAVLTAEAAAYSEIEPTFTEVVFTPFKYTKEVVASEEVLEDSRFDLWGEIIQPDAVQAFAEAENAAFAVGTGSSQPEGVTVNAPTGVTLATGQTVTITSADSILALYYALDFKYRNNATWMMNDATMALIRGLKDSQNRYLLADNINNVMTAPVQTILGRPVVINNGMPVPAASARTIVFGDFRYFVIADRIGLTVKFVDQLLAANGRVAWFIRKRFDSHMMLTTAFTRLVQSAT